MTQPAHIVLELVPVGGRRWLGVPARQRLRSLLKIALRRCGLRVVRVEMPDAAGPGEIVEGERA